ncbi:MAG: hypothetical protein ACE15C_18430 [Phycisphaerae bacterium]
MADYSYIKSNGRIVGLWLREPMQAKDHVVLMSMISREHKLSGELMVQIIGRKYKVFPNTFNNSGGCFVMFFGTPPPGQRA